MRRDPRRRDSQESPSSESHKWLVVSCPKEQYKGIVTVNSQSGHAFLLTATVGQVSGGGGLDKFRIKIWRLSADKIVCDNVGQLDERVSLETDGVVKVGQGVAHLSPERRAGRIPMTGGLGRIVERPPRDRLEGHRESPLLWGSDRTA